MRRAMALLAAVAAISACTEVREIQRVEAIQLVMADTAGQTRTLAYQLPDRRGKAPHFTVLRGPDCQLGSQRPARSVTFVIDDEEYAHVFQNELRRAGYQAHDAVSAHARGSTAEFHVRALISGVRSIVCLPEADQGDTYEGKGEASMTVNWRIYATPRWRLVYSTTQVGYARIDNTIPGAPRELLRAAFARAVHGLMADEGFRAALRSR